MVAPRKTQSLTDFRQDAVRTLDRLNRTGEAEVLTVDGKARAVLVAPEKYDEITRELTLARDVANIRASVAEHDRGECRPVDEFFDELRQKLLSMKRAQMRKKSR